MTDSTESLLLSTVVAIASVVVAIATVVYAILTSRLVKETSRLRAQADARLYADTAELVQSILSEYSQIVDIARRVELEVKFLAGFTGRGSWTEQRTTELQAIPSELKPLCRKAEEQAVRAGIPQKRSPEELSSLSGSLFSDLARLRAEKEKLRDELDNLRAQNQQHRALTMRRIP